MATALKNLKFSDQVVVPEDLDSINARDAENLGDHDGNHLFWNVYGDLAYVPGSAGCVTVFASLGLYDATGQGGCTSDQFFRMERAAPGLLWFGGNLWSLSCPSISSGGSGATIGESGPLVVTCVG